MKNDFPDEFAAPEELGLRVLGCQKDMRIRMFVSRRCNSSASSLALVCSLLCGEMDSSSGQVCLSMNWAEVGEVGEVGEAL